MNSIGVKYKIASKIVMSTIGEEAVILDPVKGSYYGLDEVGVEVWNQLSESAKTPQQLVEYIQSVYEVAQEECLKDVSELLDTLYQAGLIEVDKS